MWDLKLIVVVIVASLVVLGGTGIIVYFLRFRTKLQGVALQGLDRSRIARPGAHITIRPRARQLRDWNLEFTTDGGQTFRQVKQNITTSSFEWILPEDTFSDQCVLRILNATNVAQRADSAPFRVIPRFALTSVAMRAGVKVYVPGTVVLDYATSSSLVESTNLKLQTSLDHGVTWSDLSGDNHLVTVPRQQHVVWSVSSALSGHSGVRVRLMTTNLIAQGYDQELTAQGAGTIDFRPAAQRAGDSGSNAAGGTSIDTVVFSALIPSLHGSKSAAGAHFVPGEGVDLLYTLSSGSVSDANALVWSYSTNEGVSFRTLTAFLISGQQFHVTIPLGTFPRIRFRLALNGTTNAPHVTTKDFPCGPQIDDCSLTFEKTANTVLVNMTTLGFTPAQLDNPGHWTLSHGGREFTAPTVTPLQSTGSTGGGHQFTQLEFQPVPAEDAAPTTDQVRYADVTGLTLSATKC